MGDSMVRAVHIRHLRAVVSWGEKKTAKETSACSFLPLFDLPFTLVPKGQEVWARLPITQRRGRDQEGQRKDL